MSEAAAEIETQVRETLESETTLMVECNGGIKNQHFTSFLSPRYI